MHPCQAHRAIRSRGACIAPARRPCALPLAASLCQRPYHTRYLRAPLVQASASASASSYNTFPVDNAFVWGDKSYAPTALPAPPKTSTFGAVLPYLMSLALGEKHLIWRIVVAILLMFTSKLAGLACPFFIKQAVDTLTGVPTLLQAIHIPLPWFAAAAPPAVQGALMAVACFGICDVIKHVAKEAQAPTFLPVTQAVARRVSYHTFEHMLQLDVRFHLEKRTGRVSRILERGPRSLQYIYRAALFIFLPTTFELVAVCTVLAKTFNPIVGGLVASTFLLYVAWSIVMTQKATEVRKQVIELDNLTTSKAVDALLNFETVTLFNNQKLEVRQYDNYVKEYQDATGTTEQLSAMLNAGQAIILAMGMASVMFAAVLVGRGGAGATAGDLVMIQGLLLQLWAPLQFLGWLYRELKNSLVDVEEFIDIMRTTSSIKDGTEDLPNVAPALASWDDGTASGSKASNGASSSHAGNGAFVVPHRVSNGSVRYSFGSGLDELSSGTASTSHSSTQDGPSNGHARQSGRLTGLEIEMRNVDFGYTDQRQILHGLSIRVEPGQSVAIVGPSGSGKSTVLKLLTRQYDIQEGSIQLNGCEMSDLKLDSLRSAVAVVPQDTVLFNDTIMQNIRYGRPEASDEDVIESARMAHLDTAVAKMPKGFQTVVGERGMKLSGGEKQRVAIARAFLRAPRLLICDEATSALDSETEAQIIKSLDELAQGRTSIFVAHRLSTVKGCDKIIVLRDGTVAEEGSHKELMRKEHGLYRTMWERQEAEELHHSQFADVATSLDDAMSSDDESVISGIALRTRSAV